MNKTSYINKGVAETPTSGSCNEFNTSSTIELTSYQSPEAKAKEKEADATRDLAHSTSDYGALIHVIKSCLGTGILTVPHGFKDGGLLFGLVGALITGILCAHCSHLVVKCAQELCYILKKPSLCYADTVEAAFQIGAGKKLNKYSKLARNVLDFFQFVTYFGANTVYVILIASSFQEVMKAQLGFTMNIRIYTLLLWFILVPIGSVRHMKYLVPFSAIANILMGFGLSLTMYYILQDLPPIESRAYVGTPKGVAMLVSILFLGMEGIGTILPIENSMKTPHHFLGCPGVLNFAMSIVVALFMMIGFFGFLKYGNAIQGSVTFNLPHDWLGESVKMCVALAVLFTYSLQLTASIEVLWNHAKHRFPPPNDERAYYIIRSLLITATVLVGVAVPNLAPVVSLVGAIGFATLGVTIPAILETVLYWDDGLGAYNWRLWKNIVLFIFSLFAIGAGTISSVIEIIDEYQL